MSITLVTNKHLSHFLFKIVKFEIYDVKESKDVKKRPLQRKLFSYKLSAHDLLLVILKYLMKITKNKESKTLFKTTPTSVFF